MFGSEFDKLYHTSALARDIESLKQLVVTLTTKAGKMADKIDDVLTAVGNLEAAVTAETAEVGAAVTDIQALQAELVNNGVLSADQNARLDQAIQRVAAATGNITTATTTLTGAVVPPAPAPAAGS